MKGGRVNLDDTQRRLEDHFAALAATRVGEGYPMYALEHPFGPEERTALNEALVAQLSQRGRPNEAHWLVWVAAAAEVGYRYNGDQYWTSFQTAFPTWQDGNKSRSRIRTWFESFAEKYRGHAPKGRWASAFPIIAWPISHSVLPRFLQRLFAEHLHAQLAVLTRSGELTSDEIGELLLDRYEGYNTRFGDFLQQTELTGRLVLALHFEAVDGAISPISAHAWTRIVASLERHEDAGRRWKEVRRVLRQGSFQIARGGGSPARPRGSQGAGASVRRAPALRLIAHQRDEQCWRLAVAIPDVATALRAASIQPRDLDRMRVRVHGGAGAPRHGRTLFSYTGEAEEELHAAPPADGKVFSFEQPVEAAVAKVADALVLRDAAPWLLRVHDDGVARQVLGKHIRARQSYLLAARTPLKDAAIADLKLTQLISQTDGVSIYRLTPPVQANNAYLAALARVGLGYALGASLAPVALTPRWDGAADALTALVDEPVLLCLSSDLAANEFSLVVDGVAHRIPAPAGPILLELSDLSIGEHEVQATALGVAGGKDLTSDLLRISVRARTPWMQGIAGKAGLRLALEPRNASLDDIIDDRAHLNVIAPAGRRAAIEARLYGFHGYLDDRLDLGVCKTPVTRGALQQVLRRLRREPLAEKVAGAPRIDIAARLDEFGAEAIQFEQAVDPLRWSLPPGAGARARLVDDTGAEAIVERYQVDAPDRPFSVAAAEAMAGLVIAAPGALLVARHGGRSVSALVGVVESGQGLQGLGCSVALTTPNQKNAAHYLNLYKRWRNARLLGALADSRRDAVLHAIEDRLMEIVCGAGWAERVLSVRYGDSAIQDLSVDRPATGFDSAMRMTDWRRSDALAEFVRVSSTYDICKNADICAVAFKFAFDPGALRPADLPAEFNVDDLADYPKLIRGGYLAELATRLRRHAELAEQAA